MCTNNGEVLSLQEELGEGPGHGRQDGARFPVPATLAHIQLPQRLQQPQVDAQTLLTTRPGRAGRQYRPQFNIAQSWMEIGQHKSSYSCVY